MAGREADRQSSVGDLGQLAEYNAAGAACVRSGQPSAAVVMLEKALAGCRTQLGPTHPQTAIVARNLAAARFAASDLAAGVEAIAANFADRGRLFGDSDPRTLTAGAALATAYRAAGKREQAGRLHERIAAERHRVLGWTHPDTLISRMGVALGRADAGDVESAATLLEAALTESESIHGTGHPHSIVLRATIGTVNDILRDVMR
jgi:Tetratricopeptide repeat